MTIIALPHPDWCEPALCDAEVPTLPAAGGVHRSSPQRLVLLTLPMGDSVLVVTQLQRPGAIPFGESERKRWSLEQAADLSTVLALQVGGGSATLVPVDQARSVVEHIAPLLGLTVEASCGV
ncbi:hypothetical protein ABZ793_33065 [Micromonospora sp. NPDC047465]|uniref:hypothetical protein n=1 Tax=Micromonospora sp. NPDC047465 TaxID=3154813 RepID=UPI003401B27C